MGLFGNRESIDSIMERIRNNEATVLFSNALGNMLNPGGDMYQWLMQNSKERMIKLEVYKEGVLLKKIEVSRIRLKQTGTYDVDSNGFGFGASGFQDLPNGDYVIAFRRCILDRLKENCSNIRIDQDDYIMINENAKIGW